jgi:hypothetical protein
MSIDAVIFRTFRKLGIDDADATQFADELNAAIDKRYELHYKQLFTKSDGELMKADLVKTIAESQRWTITVMFAGLASVAVIQKLL